MNEKTSLTEKCRHFFASPKGWAVFLLLCAVCITGIVYLITTTNLLLVGWKTLHAPTMLLLNILPVLLMILFFFFCTGRLLFSATISGAVFIVFAIIDRFKVSMRQEPLLPTDLTLVKETVEIVKTFPPLTIILFALLLVFFAVLSVVLFRTSKNTKPALKVRAVGTALVLLCAWGANQCWYANKALYDSYPVIDSPYFEVNQYNTKGMIYSFLHQFNISQLKAPNGYQASFYAEQENIDWAPPEGETYPHIIMIMGEAFTDMSENPHLDFSGYRDPLQNFKEISSRNNAVSGHIIVPNFGGGTSNSEYDVLTGCGTRYLENPLPSYSFIHRDFDGIPRRLKQLGYETLSIHPGYAWFYNRQNVYPDLGFDTCYFLEDSFDLSEQGIGGYINESATMDKIIQTLDTHIQEKESPLFSFTVTIQNHGPYDKKYGTKPANFSSDIPLNESQTDLLTHYFRGISDADEQLGRLYEYANASDEPIVIVYFGDHLPGFSNGTEFFDLLDYPIDANGSTEEQINVYKTPYLIWQNDSAKKLTNLSANAKNTDLTETISAQFLGTTMLELLEIDTGSPLYELNNMLRRELPVCTKYIYMDQNGTYSGTISEEQRYTVDKMIGWQYYKLFDQKLS